MDSLANLTTERRTFVSRLECGLEGDDYTPDEVHGLSKAGKPLLVRYDLSALEAAVSKEEIAARPPDLWRYREFLPVRKAANIVSLGEVMTPLVRLAKLEAGSGALLIACGGWLVAR